MSLWLPVCKTGPIHMPVMHTRVKQACAVSVRKGMATCVGLVCADVFHAFSIDLSGTKEIFLLGGFSLLDLLGNYLCWCSCLHQGLPLLRLLPVNS